MSADNPTPPSKDHASGQDARPARKGGSKDGASSVAKNASLQKVQLKKRSASRLMAVQALYQAMQGYGALSALIPDFAKGGMSLFLKNEGIEGDVAYFQKLATPFLDHGLDFLDEKISLFLTHPWHFDRLEALFLAVLRVGTCELWQMDDDQREVLILNEYVTLAHSFFGGQEPRVVHAVLQKICKRFQESQEKSGLGADQESP